MDQKALSHLDPKARETYDRVMGTAAVLESPSTTPPATDPMSPAPASPDSGFVPLTPTDTSGGMSAQVAPTPTPDAAFSNGPADLTMAGSGSVVNTDSTFDTPGAVSGPTDMTQAPVDTNTLSAPLPDMSQPTPAAPADTAAPSMFTASPAPQDVQNATSSFFTNPSPDSSESTAPAPSFDPNPTTQPATPSFDAPADTALATDTMSPLTPVTPYTPTGLNENQAPVAVDQPFAQQPMTSPAAANQAAPHQTSALLKVLYIVAAVVFFAIYTIFWIKVFNLPFLF